MSSKNVVNVFQIWYNSSNVEQITTINRGDDILVVSRNVKNVKHCIIYFYGPCFHLLYMGREKIKKTKGLFVSYVYTYLEKKKNNKDYALCETLFY